MAVIEAISMGIIPIVSEASRETIGTRGITINGDDPSKWASLIQDYIVDSRDRPSENVQEQHDSPNNRKDVEELLRLLYDSQIS